MPTTLELLEFGAVVFFAALGATFQLANRSAGGLRPSFQVVVSFLAAVLLTSVLGAILMFKGNVYWLYVTVFGMLFGLAAEHVIRLIMNYQTGAKSLWKYIVRMKKVSDLVTSGKIDLDDHSTNNENQTPPTP